MVCWWICTKKVEPDRQPGQGARLRRQAAAATAKACGGPWMLTAKVAVAVAGSQADSNGPDDVSGRLTVIHKLTTARAPRCNFCREAAVELCAAICPCSCAAHAAPPQQITANITPTFTRRPSALPCLLPSQPPLPTFLTILQPSRSPSVHIPLSLLILVQFGPGCEATRLRCVRLFLRPNRGGARFDQTPILSGGGRWRYVWGIRCCSPLLALLAAALWPWRMLLFLVCVSTGTSVAPYRGWRFSVASRGSNRVSGAMAAGRGCLRFEQRNQGLWMRPTPDPALPPVQYSGFVINLSPMAAAYALWFWSMLADLSSGCKEPGLLLTTLWTLRLSCPFIAGSQAQSHLDLLERLTENSTASQGDFLPLFSPSHPSVCSPNFCASSCPFPFFVFRLACDGGESCFDKLLQYIIFLRMKENCSTASDLDLK